MVQILLVAIANKPADVTWKRKAEKHQGKKSKKNKNNKKKNLFGSYNNPFVPYLRPMLLMQPLPTPLSPSAWFTHKLPEVINIFIQQTGHENIPTYQEEAAILI